MNPNAKIKDIDKTKGKGLDSLIGVKKHNRDSTSHPSDDKAMEEA